MQKYLFLLPLAFALAAGCSDTKPKNLTKNKISFDNTDSNTPDSFKFNFAYRNPAATSPLHLTIYLQGASTLR